MTFDYVNFYELDKTSLIMYTKKGKDVGLYSGLT